MAPNRARMLRVNQTPAERALWYRLRRRQLGGHRFRRQHPLGPYVVDFVCLKERLVIELDGGQHAVREEHDAKRTLWLEHEGFQVVRFWNIDVFTNLDGVCDAILHKLAGDRDDR